MDVEAPGLECTALESRGPSLLLENRDGCLASHFSDPSPPLRPPPAFGVSAWWSAERVVSRIKSLKEAHILVLGAVTLLGHVAKGIKAANSNSDVERLSWIIQWGRVITGSLKAGGGGVGSESESV